MDEQYEPEGWREEVRNEFFAAALSGLMANPYLAAQNFTVAEHITAASVAADEAMAKLGYDVPARG